MILAGAAPSALSGSPTTTTSSSGCSGGGASAVVFSGSVPHGFPPGLQVVAPNAGWWGPWPWPKT